MKLVQFNQFEKALNLLETHSPESVSDEMLLENNITREDLILVNEGWLKDQINKFFHGGDFEKADKILARYKEAKLKQSESIIAQRNKAYKAAISGATAGDKLSSVRSAELKKRAEKAVEAIEAASKSKFDALQNQLKSLVKDVVSIRGKESATTTVQEYIDLKLAEIQEEAANKELEAYQKSVGDDADEKMLDELEKSVADAKKSKDDAANLLKEIAAKKEASKKQSETDKAKNKEKKDAEAKGKEESAKKESDAKANDPANAKVGQVWIYKDKEAKEKEVKIVAALGDESIGKGLIQVKGDKEPYPVKPDRLVKLVKDIEKK